VRASPTWKRARRAVSRATASALRPAKPFVGNGYVKPGHSSQAEHATVTNPRSYRRTAVADAPDAGRTYLTAGQRVAHVEGADGASSSERDDAPDIAAESDATQPVAGSGGGLAAVQRAAFGTCVGGAVAVLGPIVVSRSAVALLLVAGVALAVGWHGWLAVRRTAERRPGGLGVAIGLGLVVAAVRSTGAGAPLEVGTQALGGLALLAGFAAYAVLGEYERHRLRESFPALRVRS